MAGQQPVVSSAPDRNWRIWLRMCRYSQDIKGSSDNVRFTFGNADRVMTQLANDTDLKYAEIDLCLYHVKTRPRIRSFWKGVIQNYTSDGTANFMQLFDSFLRS